MNTKGWDLELSWSDQINDFRYGVSFNLSDYRSKMGYMANRQKIDDNKITEEGSYFNEWYGYKSMGIILNDAAMLDENGNTIPVLTNNDKAGNIRYQDIDGDGQNHCFRRSCTLGQFPTRNAIRWLSMGRMERLGFQFIISRCWTSISLLELARYTIQLSSICLSGKSDRKPLESDSNGCRKCQGKISEIDDQ